MGKVFNILYLLTFIFVLTSCESKRKERAIAAVQSFYNSYKNDDYDGCRKLYPNIGILEGDFYKTDELELKGIFRKENNPTDYFYIVFCENKWTNDFGKTHTREMRFYLKETNNKDVPFLITDSKGFLYPEDNINKFAVNTGAIEKNDTTDILKSKKLKEAKKVFNTLKERVRNGAKEGMSSNWNWDLEDYYGNYASGRCTVTNNSKNPVKNPKYRINYRRTKKGDVVATDDGVITYGWMYPNESKSVTWFTNNLPSGINWCQFEIILDEDDEWVEEVVLSMPLDGLWRFIKDIDKYE